MWTVYIVFAWLTGICYGFVLISSAAGQNDVDLFEVGVVQHYQYHSTVILNEQSDRAKNVGFFIAGDVLVHGLWGSGDDRILKLELRSPQLHIRSRKAPAPDGFIEHSSNLEGFSLRPFYVTWRGGRIEKVLVPQGEPVALTNFNKGIASLFQVHILDVELNETDSSGFCTANYQTVDPTRFHKFKTNCISPDFPSIATIDPILGVNMTSLIQVTYQLNPTFSHIETIYAKEGHHMILPVKEDIGSVVETRQILTCVKKEKTKVLTGESLEEVWKKVAPGHVEETLLTKKEELVGDDKSFVSLVNDLRDNLATKNLGNLVSAKAFLRLLDASRKATKEEISKVLGVKKNQKILSQIYDILGYIQTPEAHAAVMKKLHFDREDHLDSSERYLWSLSMSPHPNPEILKDLLDRYRKNDNFPDKVKETLILTVAAMARLTDPQHRKIVRGVEEIIVNSLSYAKGERRYVFLRALKNLKSPDSVPLLLKVIKEGSFKEGVLAFKALKSMDSSMWSHQVLKTARTTFFQLDKRHDSSSRTLAVDILLESQPTDNVIRDFLHYLTLNDSSFEVKQYVMQRLQMMADEDQNFNSRLVSLIRSDPGVNNYDILALKGLSTALRRTFLKSASSNGSLLAIQEVFAGIVKRGIINVMMDRHGATKEMFSLGIFAGGLSGLLGGEVEGDEEAATAGMELTILDNQIRPFVFFNGQGELMGHVWSGTASDRTTAFQSLILLQDHLKYIRLAPGFIAEFNLKGGMSFDLSGQAEISLWGRTANSIVEKSAGIVTRGLTVVDTSFIRSQIEFSASVEPKLNLKSDIDFSGNMNLCMRVTQPDSTFRHNIFKIERIPGSKHKLRFAKYKKTTIPGTTYSLNRKNNEICSAMYS